MCQTIILRSLGRHDPATRFGQQPPRSQCLCAHYEGMVGFFRQWIADNLLSGSLEFLNGEFDEAEAIVTQEYFVWVSTLPGDHH